MGVIRAESRFRRVIYRRCATCHYVVSQVEVERMVIDLPCPRCGEGRMSGFEPIRPTQEGKGFVCENCDGGPDSA